MSSDEHLWFHESIEAFLCGGLDVHDVARFRSHREQCPACRERFEQAWREDQMMQVACATAVCDQNIEQRLIAGISPGRWAWGRPVMHPAVRRAGAAIAATLLLGTLGSLWLNAPSHMFRFASPDARQVLCASDLPQMSQAPSIMEYEDTDGKVVATTQPRVLYSTSGGMVAHNSVNEPVPSYSLGRGSRGLTPAQEPVVTANGGPNRGFSIGASVLPNLVPTPGTDSSIVPWGSAKRDAGSKGISVAAAGDTTVAETAALEKGGPHEAVPAPKPSADVPAQPVLPEAATVAPSPSPAPVQADSIQFSRKVIRNGKVEFEVESFDSAFAIVSKIAAEDGGYVTSTESEKLPNGKTSGTVTVRIPPDRLDGFILKLRALGDLKSQSISAQDVTKQYTDLESQLRAAKAMQDRLLEIIKSGKGEIKDLVAAEKELGVWREKTEQVEGEIRFYNSQIALSTLQVVLSERDVKSAATATETELRSIGIGATDVEKAYAQAQTVITDAKGRIVDASLKKLDAGQIVASVTCDVTPEQAGPLTDRLKQLGTLGRLEVERKQVTDTGEPAPAGTKVQRKDTRFVISLYSLGNLTPRQTIRLTLACEDIEAAYRAIMEAAQTNSGRVTRSTIAAGHSDQASATASAGVDVPVESADAFLGAIRAVTPSPAPEPAPVPDVKPADVTSAPEVVQMTSSEAPDGPAVTTSRRGFEIQLVSLASVAARETLTLNLATDDVAGVCRALSQAASATGHARIATAQVVPAGAKTLKGTLELELRRGELPQFEAALARQGDVFGRSSTRNADSQNSTDSKVRLTIAVVDSRSLPAREETAITIDAGDVSKAIGSLSDVITRVKGHTTELTLGGGATTDSGAMVADFPADKAEQVLTATRQLGKVISTQTQRNANVPEGVTPRAHLRVELRSAGIVAGDRGILSTIRNGLSASVSGLLWSLQLVVIGVCLVLPWVVILWAGARVYRRMRGRQVPVPAPSAAEGGGPAR